MSSFLNFVFGVIRGVQDQREFYITRCQINMIVKIFLFDNELISAEMKNQSPPSQASLSEDALYVIGNPIHKAFVPIVAFIDGSFTYEPLDDTTGHKDVGQLIISADVPLVVAEGEHRRSAIELALQERPELEESYIPVILYQSINQKHFETKNAVYNSTIQRQDNSLDISDVSSRDRPTVIAKAVMAGVKVFRHLTDVERSSLPMRSQKLFTLSAIENSTQALLADHEDDELGEQIQLAIRYWNAVSANIPDWSNVLRAKVSAGIIRRDYVHGHAVTLAALGHLGASLISNYPETWETHLEKLQQIDWSRSNPEWQYRIIVGGRISKSRISVSLMTVYLKKTFGLALNINENKLERDNLSKEKIFL